MEDLGLAVMLRKSASLHQSFCRLKGPLSSCLWLISWGGHKYGLKSECHTWGNNSQRLQRIRGVPGGSDGTESALRVWDLASIPGLGRSPGGGHGNQFQSSCLENPTDGGAWRLESTGPQRVGHNWATNTLTFRYWNGGWVCACVWEFFWVLF